MDTIPRHREQPHQNLRDAFRGFMSTYFTGVAVITSLDEADRPHGLTCNSLTSITLSPPTLLICLDQASGTLAALLATRTFAVNLLHDRGKRAAEIFASRDPDRFRRVPWQRSAHTGVPLLAEDAYAAAECEVTDTTVVGDHMVVFGRVVHVRNDTESPLLYGMREFARQPEPVA